MKKIFPFIVAAMLLLAACGGAKSSFEPVNEPLAGAAPFESRDTYAAQPAPTASFYSGESANSAGGNSASSVERIVIQNADLAIVVVDVEGRMKIINDMAREMGGFVVSSNLYENYARNGVKVPEGSMTIRVPAERLEEALSRIKQDVDDVQSESRSGTDVTAEYVDLKSRLKNLEAAEAQLNEIMKTTTDPDAVINVFNQLVYYREQIEIVKGQIKYYEEAAALSAISVRIIAKETIQPIEIAGWEPQGVARDAIQDLIYFWQDFVDFMIRFIIYTLPVLITIAIPLYLGFLGLRWVFRKLRGGQKTEQKPPQQTKEKK